MYETAYDYPALPQPNDPQWMQVMIRSRVQSSTALRTQPSRMGETVLLMVYSGDVVSVMRDVRHDDWIAAKVGYKMGWLNVNDIGFKLIRQYDYVPLTRTQEMRALGSSPKPASKPTRPNLGGLPMSEEWFEITTEHAIPEELLMSHVDQVKAQTQESACVSSKDVGRIIKYLKSFAGAFGGRRAAASSH